MEELKQRWEQKWGQVVHKANGDATFKKRLMTESSAVLKEFGITVKPGVAVHIIDEDAENAVYLYLPSQQLSEEQLEKVTGGAVEAPPSPPPIRPPGGGGGLNALMF